MKLLNIYLTSTMTKIIAKNIVRINKNITKTSLTALMMLYRHVKKFRHGTLVSCKIQVHR